LKKTTPIFVLTIKNSKREKIITKRLNYLGLNYKIFYSIDGGDKKNYSLLRKKYDKYKAEIIFGRPMSYTDISCAHGHISIYQHIIKKKITKAVIMEDDCFPSKKLSQWVNINENDFKNLDIIQLYCDSGLVYKKPFRILKDNFKVYKARVHLPTTTCYQINLKTCEYILRKTKGKISTVADWPILFNEKKINQFIVLPYIATVHFEHSKTSFNKSLWSNSLNKRKLKKFIPFYTFLTIIYIFLHIPYILRSTKLYSYYKEQFLDKKIALLINILFFKYIDLNNINYQKSFYEKDLHDNINKINFSHI
jgi:GR25 family glycosyltransferase involved in LPS biosynthesis